MFEIRHPKLDELYAGAIFVGLAVTALFIFRVALPFVLPPKIILPVPFSPQAPTNNWSRNEDCEETSITMANAYLTGSTEDKLPAAAAQNAINNLKAWEQANLGYNANTGIDATTKMAQGAFGLKIIAMQNYTEDDIKKQLTAGYPILLPINAKLLKTAQYANGGPTYHMIVIRGFKGNTFIVNDPGTNNGDGNEYSFATLKNASADWNPVSKSIDSSRKIALAVSR